MEIAFSALKHTLWLVDTLAKSLVGLASRIAAKGTSCSYALYVNRLLGRSQGRIRMLRA